MAITMSEGLPAGQTPSSKAEAAANINARTTHVTGYEIRTGSFTGSIETGPNKRGKTETFNGREKPGFSEERREDMTTYTAGHLEQIIKMSRDLSPDDFNKFINSDTFRNSKKLYDKFTKIEEGPDGKPLRTIDKGLLDTYMESDEGQVTALAIRQRDLDLESQGAGVIAQISPDRHEQGAVDKESRTIAPGTWGWNLEQRIKQWWDKPGETKYGKPSPGRVRFTEFMRRHHLGGIDVTTQGGLTSGLGKASIVGGILGSLGGPIGTGVGALTPEAAALVAKAMGRGETVDYTQSTAALKRIQNNDPVKIWMKAKGIDVDDFIEEKDADGNPTGKIKMKDTPGYTPGTRLSKDAIANNLFADAIAVWDAQQQLGVNPADIEVMSNSFLYQDKDRPPQTGLDFHQKVIDRFKALGGRDPHNLNDSLKRWDQAYSDALSEHLDRSFKDVLDTAKESDTIKEKIKTRRTARNNDKATLQQAVQAEVEALDKNRGELSGSATAIDDFQILTSGKEQERKRLKHEKAELEQKVTIPASSPGMTPEQVLNKLLTEKTPYAVTIDGVEYDAIQHKHQEIEQYIKNEVIDYRNKLTSGPTPLNPKQLSESVAAYQALLTNDAKTYDYPMLEAQANEIKDILTQLKQKNNQITAAQQVLSGRSPLEADNKNNETVHKTEQTISSMIRARSDVESWDKTGVTTLSANDLQTKTFDELQAEINKAYNDDPMKGWPAGENTNEANRHRLLMAMAEARADKSFADPSDPFKEAADTSVWALQEQELLILPAGEIEKRMRDRSGSIGGRTVPSIDEINALKTEAFERLPVRQRALRDMILTLDNQRASKYQEQQSIEKGIPTPELDEINRITDRFGTIWQEMLDEKKDMNKFLSTDTVTRTAGTPDERDYLPFEGGKSKADLEMRQLVFDYRHQYDTEYNGKKGPEAAYDLATKLLPQERLFEELRDRFNLMTPAGNPVGDFNEARDALRERMGLTGGTQDIYKEDLAAFFSENIVIQYLGRQVERL